MSKDNDNVVEISCVKGEAACPSNLYYEGYEVKLRKSNDYHPYRFGYSKIGNDDKVHLLVFRMQGRGYRFYLDDIGTVEDFTEENLRKVDKQCLDTARNYAKELAAKNNYEIIDNTLETTVQHS